MPTTPGRFQRLRRLFKWMLRITLALTFCLLVLEIVYRNQWIDTYRGPLLALNADDELKEEGRTVLVMGDSFSATRDGWVKEIADRLPEYRVVNASVSGTGIVQANIIARRRFREFKPDILIYQIYVGNDLLDYRYPIAWGKVSPLRNIYWWWAHRLRSIAYLNQAFGQIKAGPSPQELAPLFRKPFAVETYNSREKTLLTAEPGLIENQVFLENGRENDMVGYLRRLDDILALCEANGTIPYLLVLPHCAQVHPQYKEQMVKLGAEFRLAWHTRADYPFVNRLAGHTQGRATVLNPLSALQSAFSVSDPLYFNNDPHLTPAGQKWLGNWVVNAIQQSPVGD